MAHLGDIATETRRVLKNIETKSPTVDWITSGVQDGKTEMATDKHR
jgi:hypothetical protein